MAPSLRARRWRSSIAFTLPTGADGSGNIQITVTANVNHTAFASATSLTNANLRTYANGGDYPSAPTTLTVGGVDFALIPNGTTVVQPGHPADDRQRHVVRHPGQHQPGGPSLNTLINSTYGNAGDTVGHRRGQRDGRGRRRLQSRRRHQHPRPQQRRLREHDRARHALGVVRQRPGSPRHADVRPAQRVRHGADHGHHPHQQRRYAARQPVPGGGHGDDGIRPVAARSARQRRGARRPPAPRPRRSFPETSLPGQVSIVLDPGSDSGVQGDDLTNDTTPTFDVTVNEGGSIQIDYKGDGTSTASQTVTAAGEYSFTSPALADGQLHRQGDLHADCRHRGHRERRLHDRHQGSRRSFRGLHEPRDRFTPARSRSARTSTPSTISASSISISGPGITGIDSAGVRSSGRARPTW